MGIINKIRRILDSTTTYRVVLYSLGFMAASTLTLSRFNVLTYSSFGTLALTLGLLISVCFSLNILMGWLYKLPINHESSLITALILFFVLATPKNGVGWVGIGYAAVVAIASKFVITWRASHIFNPAAFGVLVVSLMGIGNGAWWIADRSLFIPMLIVGTLVLMKLRRFELFWAFIIPALVLILVKDMSGSPLPSILTTALTLYPLLFLGTVMLTEPATMPTERFKRLAFGAIVGLVFASNFDFGFIAASPHLALIIGNIFAFIVTWRAGVRLKLVEKKQLTPTTYSFTFEPSRPIKYLAGQYMELTLPGVEVDARGNRRTFTIASPPSEKLIKFGIKFYNPGSKFKTKLNSLKIGDEVLGGHVGGDFTLPKQLSRESVFIAGGIGITPFISMIGSVLAGNDGHNPELYYFVSDKNEVAYKNILRAALAKGMKISIRLGKSDKLTDADINKHPGADFYLSGPPGLVNAYKLQLNKQGIKRIHTDYFNGY